MTFKIDFPWCSIVFMTYLPQGRFSLSLSLSHSHTHTRTYNHLQRYLTLSFAVWLRHSTWSSHNLHPPTSNTHTHTHAHSQIPLCIEFQGQAGLPISIVMTSRRMFEICLLVIKIVEKTNDYVFALIRNRPLLSFSKSSLVRWKAEKSRNFC